MTDKIKDFLALMEEHGLLNKVIDKLLSPESLEAISYGATKAAMEKYENKKM